MNHDPFRLAEAWSEPLIAFCQDLIRIPSLPGEEGLIAERVAEEMKRLGYDSVAIDRAGNVIGRMRGRGGGPSLMLNSHLDHVDVGDHSRWPYPPFGGTLADGAIWGRGASDVKAPFAVQVLAPAILRQAGVEFDGDIVVTGVVMEEIGGVGTLALLEHLRTDVAVIGEATANRIARGHRGRIELLSRIFGKSAHASAPSRGVNPLYGLARFLRDLERLVPVVDPVLGPASVAPTLLATDQISPNVIPSEVRLTLDWRSVPAETAEAVVDRVATLLATSLTEGMTGQVDLLEKEWTTWTGYQQAMRSANPSFALATDDPLVVRTRETLDGLYGKPTPVIRWDFATDGGHLVAAGIPSIGFSPGREELVHTVEERIMVDELIAGLAGYLALVPALSSGAG